MKPIDWTGSWTLEDYIIHLFETKQTHSEEFKILLRIYGREKVEAIWRKYKAKCT